MTSFSRRFFLAGGALAAASPALAQFGARAPFPQTFSSFAVDVGPLKAKGLGGFADLVGNATLAELRIAFADRVDPRGPRLVVRLNQIYLTPFPDGGGGDGWFRGGGGGTDSIDGVALAVGRRGEVLAQHPQLAVLDIRRSILDPDEQGRAVAIAQHYVRWLRREI
ncbi:hypothetical protein [Microvirga pudoricolor]|uniref:hypothetical protein n=1 Tax=Microvirga pudoricolor TaxID=2778729 RepID=UPI00194DF955|nr:hypothetical protein [Microvirga pudoricolor]MBM6595855.1 hypothetical protein [Microvirga pudoricolor]